MALKINASQRTGSENQFICVQRPIPSNVNLSVSMRMGVCVCVSVSNLWNFHSVIFSLTDFCSCSLSRLFLLLFFSFDYLSFFCHEFYEIYFKLFFIVLLFWLSVDPFRMKTDNSGTSWSHTFVQAEFIYSVHVCKLYEERILKIGKWWWYLARIDNYVVTVENKWNERKKAVHACSD